MTTLRATILGCGSSGGVPRIGNDWGACDPAEPKNRRRRCSLLVDRGGTSVLIDTSPDLREQLLDAGVMRLDAVLYTHAHADQAHGIDDLRALSYLMRRRIPTWADADTLDALSRRFSYCFHQAPDSGYPAILRGHVIDGPLRVTGPGGVLDVIPFPQEHGGVISLGFRIGPLAYSSDVVGLPEESFAALEGVRCWIVDALRDTPHPTHAHVDLALEWIARLRPERAILTNLHVDLDYHDLRRRLPKGVEPAYDGMVIEV
jgi:phosphoribosyl 1,2-cyclic phosphate phosphodiesterase